MNIYPKDISNLNYSEIGEVLFVERVIVALTFCHLFQKLSIKQIEEITKEMNLKLASYKKNDVLAIEGDPCTKIGIVIEGRIEINKLLANGKNVNMETLTKGDVFGEVILFLGNSYPATIVASQNSEVLFISKEEILEMLSLNRALMEGVLKLFAQKVFLLNQKVTLLSLQTIRQKLTWYLINEYKRQKALTINLESSKINIAEKIGIPRPSLSRELINMQDDGLIILDKNKVTIVELKKLEACLYS